CSSSCALLPGRAAVAPCPPATSSSVAGIRPRSNPRRPRDRPASTSSRASLEQSPGRPCSCGMVAVRRGGSRGALHDWRRAGSDRVGDIYTARNIGGTAMLRPDWYLDELAHAGPEHLDPATVAAYDRKAGTDPAPDVAALRALGLDGSSVLVDL